jgi:hypothetical protein
MEYTKIFGLVSSGWVGGWCVLIYCSSNIALNSNIPKLVLDEMFEVYNNYVKRFSVWCVSDEIVWKYFALLFSVCVCVCEREREREREILISFAAVDL